MRLIYYLDKKTIALVARKFPLGDEGASLL